MERRRHRFMIALVLATLVLPSAGTAREAIQHGRSGTIVDGVFTTGPAIGCGVQPDCAAWLVAGCPAAVAGLEASWHAAIVPVGADAGEERRFVIRRGRGESVIFGGVVVEFWTRGCDLLPGSWRSFYDCFPPACSERHRELMGMRLGVDRMRTTLHIPDGAAFMTISANDNLNIVWSLR